MRNISTYIEYTLMTRHYVFVPGIGGFLLRDIDASYVNGKYTPSHRQVHFNRFLTNDDGMLANAYMEAEGISYDEAMAQIRIEVAQIKSAIEREKSCQLGNLGVLSYDSDRHLVVKNPKHFPLDPDCYGLKPLNNRPWSDAVSYTDRDNNTNTIIRQNSEVVSIPKYWIRRAVAVILIILCVFTNMMLPSDKDARQTNIASMINTDILFGNATPNLTIQQDAWDEEVAIANRQPEEAAVKPVTAEKLFFVIIASCSTRQDAERALNRKINEGYKNVGILEKDGRFRLYLKSFTVRAEGESFLDEVRVSTPFQTAWLLPVRSDSLLSYNQKNIDNDQLSMELSHPYKRTERDQGWINT